MTDRLAMMNPSKEADDHSQEVATGSQQRLGEGWDFNCSTKKDGSMDCTMTGVTGCNDEVNGFYKCLVNSESQGTECQDKWADLNRCNEAKNEGPAQTKM